MKITLVRHAMTEANFLDLCQGLKNNPLNEDGRRRCLKLKEQLRNKHYDYCYMSPLLRCVETAIILVGDRVETIPDKRLIERDLGEFEGMPRKFYDSKKYWNYEKNISDRGVEPVKDLFARCDEFLQYIKEKHKNQDILIVTHGSPCRALRHLLLSHDLTSNLLDKDIDNLYCEEFEIKD